MTFTPSRHNAIAIDPEMDARMRLKAATTAVHDFQAVALCGTLNDALREVKEGGKTYDVVFLSERLDRQAVQSFIKELRSAASAQDAAVILLLHSTESESTKSAVSVLSGYDGCLMEPYSVDGLVQITELAARLKKERQETRMKAAIEFLVKDIMKNIDRLAYIRSCQADMGGTLRRLKEACAVFDTFDEHAMDAYLACAVDAFQTAPAAGLVGDKAVYRGVSSRIKQRMAKRIAEEMDKKG